MTDAFVLRACLKEIVDFVFLFNDIIVKVCALVLRHHLRVNGSYCDGRFELHYVVNVGIVVVVLGMFVVLVVCDVDLKLLGVIVVEFWWLAECVRSGEIILFELLGGMFMVFNFGMFGIDRFEGIINVP